MKTKKAIIERKCKRSLYKSTYKGLAFTKGKKYEVAGDDKEFFYFIDNTGAEFSMCKTKTNGFYFVDEYFTSAD